MKKHKYDIKENLQNLEQKDGMVNEIESLNLLFNNFFKQSTALVSYNPEEDQELKNL